MTRTLPPQYADFSPVNLALGRILEELLSERNMTVETLTEQVPNAADLVSGIGWTLVDAVNVVFALEEPGSAAAIWNRLAKAAEAMR